MAKKKVNWGIFYHGDRPEINNYPGVPDFKLKGVSPLQRCRVLEIEGGKYLESNLNIVAGITPDNWLFIMGLYGAETRQHIESFAKEVCGVDMKFIRELYANNQEFNLETGEYRESTKK